MKYCPLTRNERATKLRPAVVGRVVVLTAGMLLIKLTFFPHRLQSNSNSLTVFCFTNYGFTEQNSNSVSFSPSQCCRLLKVLFGRFSTEVDVVLGEVQCPSVVSSSPILVKFSIKWLAVLM